MDPDAALMIIEEGLACGEYTQASFLCGDLRSWIRRGGFLPSQRAQQENPAAWALYLELLHK